MAEFTSAVVVISTEITLGVVNIEPKTINGFIIDGSFSAPTPTPTPTPTPVFYWG